MFKSKSRRSGRRRVCRAGAGWLAAVCCLLLPAGCASSAVSSAASSAAPSAAPGRSAAGGSAGTTALVSAALSEETSETGGSGADVPPPADWIRVEQTWIDFFDTVTTVILYVPDQTSGRQYLDLANRELRRYHELFDYYRTYPGVTNIKSINDQAGGEPLTVDPAILDLMQQSKRANALSGGAVNMALGPVLQYWHDTSAAAAADPSDVRLPDTGALAEANRHTDIQAVEVDVTAGTVRLADPLGALNVGSGAKGLAAEKVARTLMESGVQSAMLSLGGNVRTIGRKPDGQPWKIGVQNPLAVFAERGDDVADPALIHRQPEPYLFIVGASDMAVVTSGVYQRYFVHNGRRYHHIIDPDTLEPSQRYDAVTIVTPDSGLADSLTTALFNLSVEDGQRLLDQFEIAEAVWVKDDRIVYSSGFKDWILPEA